MVWEKHVIFHVNKRFLVLKIAVPATFIHYNIFFNIFKSKAFSGI